MMVAKISRKLIVINQLTSRKDLEITSTFNISLDTKEFLIKICKQAISKYSSYNDISQYIHEKCVKDLGGNWIIICGEREKFKGYLNCGVSDLSLNIGNYKIIIIKIWKEKNLI